MMTRRDQFEGLEWIRPLEGCSLLRPRWTTDPDTESIKEVVKRVLPWEKEVAINFLCKGGFNKLYTIRTRNKELIMRVTLPVDPGWKTLSEVATVKWIRRNTHLPLPEIFCHNASRDDRIGFEWILMSKLPGRPLVDVWRSLDFAAKKQVTQEVAVFFASMFRKRLHGIGNLYPKLGEGEDDSGLPKVQRISSMHFFWGDHISQSVPRGPFRSSRDWLQARLLFDEKDCKSTIARCKNRRDPDEDDEEDARRAERTLALVRSLKHLLDKLDLFPASKDGDAEPSILFHEDLEQRNILVDQAGVLTGVVDWECVSALPLWKACDFPSFLKGVPMSKPTREAYVNCISEDRFWSDWVEYDKTRLRTYFLEEMRTGLKPGWVEVFEASERQRDFDTAVNSCTDGGVKPYIYAWINDLLMGRKEMLSLSFRIDNNLRG